MSSTHYASKQLLRQAVFKQQEDIAHQGMAVRVLQEENASLKQLLQMKTIECNLLKLQLKIAGVIV